MFVAVMASMVGVGVAVFGRRWAATVVGLVLAVPMFAVGALVALLHDYSESAPPPPPLHVENDSGDAVYLVWVGDGVTNAELDSKVYRNGGIATGAVGRAPLGFPDEDGLMCARSHVVLVQSISGEWRYGSNYLDDNGVRQSPEPTAADLEVVRECPRGECFAETERYVRWTGDEIVAADPPPDRFEVPGRLPPLLVAVPIGAALIASGWWIDRRRALGPTPPSG